jgi:hypothetical protein
MCVPTSDLQDFLKIQMQLNNDKKKKKKVSKFETILTNLSPNMNPFAQNNPYPLRSLTKLNVFYIIGNVKWKVTKFILTTKKEQCVRS